VLVYISTCFLPLPTSVSLSARYEHGHENIYYNEMLITLGYCLCQSCVSIGGS